MFPVFICMWHVCLVLRINMRDRWRVSFFLYVYIMNNRCFLAASLCNPQIEVLFPRCCLNCEPCLSTHTHTPRRAAFLFIIFPQADSSKIHAAPPYSRVAVVAEGAGLQRLWGSLTFGRSWEAADVCVGQDVCKKQGWILFFKPQQLELSHSYDF